MIALRSPHVKPVPTIGVPFAAIPLDVMRRKDLTPLAKLVFSAVANQARMRRSDESTLSNAQIAAAVGMTASGVRRPLDELEAAGLIRRQYGASERVRDAIRITYSPAEVVTPAPTPTAAAASQRQPGCGPSANHVSAAAPPPLSKSGKHSRIRFDFFPQGEGRKEPSRSQGATRLFVGDDGPSKLEADGSVEVRSLRRGGLTAPTKHSIDIASAAKWSRSRARLPLRRVRQGAVRHFVASPRACSEASNHSDDT